MPMDYSRLWTEQFAPHFPEWAAVPEKTPTGWAIPLVVWFRAQDAEGYWTAARIERRLGWHKGTVAAIDALIARNYPEYDREQVEV